MELEVEEASLAGVQVVGVECEPHQDHQSAMEGDVDGEHVSAEDSDDSVDEEGGENVARKDGCCICGKEPPYRCPGCDRRTCRCAMLHVLFANLITISSGWMHMCSTV